MRVMSFLSSANDALSNQGLVCCYDSEINVLVIIPLLPYRVSGDLPGLATR